MRDVRSESAKSFEARYRSGFIKKYCGGELVLDIGCGIRKLLPNAFGIESDAHNEHYLENYNGIILPFESNSVDTVYTSHVFEHLQKYALNLMEWYRVVKVGGYIIIIVPHKFLYERKARPPSKWNNDHYRFYTPASLLATVEEVLAPNCYRVRHLCDNDRDYDYNETIDKHPVGCYEIELVLQKIARPRWAWEA